MLAFLTYGAPSHALQGAPPAANPEQPFIPLTTQQPSANPLAPAPPSQEPQGESMDDWVLRRSRELNIATRERPFDLQLWLALAAFQKQAAAVGGNRVSERAVAEKQISILERALSHHPGSEALLLALLEAVECIEDPLDVAARWQRVLARHPGSGALWDRHTRAARFNYATFRAPSIRKGYCDALAALRGEAHRRQDQGAGGGDVAAVEAAWLALFLQVLGQRPCCWSGWFAHLTC